MFDLLIVAGMTDDDAGGDRVMEGYIDEVVF